MQPAPAIAARYAARGDEARLAHPAAAGIDARGRFTFRDIELRQMAHNSFVLRIDAPPNAPRVVEFSALCLDCGAGAITPQP